MTRRHHRRVAHAVVTTATAVAAIIAVTGTASAAAGAPGGPSQIPGAVPNPASLVNPFIGTSGGVFTYPGPDMPFGMMQWSPDTSPDRAGGGGYEYNDSNLTGYSLTHLSGGGCSAEGDVPILPTVGAIGNSPGSTTDTFSHSAETAKAGYYSSTLANGVTAKLTDTTHAGIGTFTFPATTQANLLLKLSNSNDQVDGTSAQVVGSNEVTGSVTAGHFCGQSSGLERDYTLHFDIVFDHPFTASGTWGGTSSSSSSVTPNARSVTGTNLRHAAVPTAQAPSPSTAVFAGPKPDFNVRPHQAPVAHGATAQAPQTTVTNPDGTYLTFDTTTDQTVTAKVGISYTSATNAAANVATEIPGWDFGQIMAANRNAWNSMLGRIQIAGGSRTQQVEFYTALYHALMHPNVVSDDNGQYMGYDGQVYTAANGHAEYANYSGWDIYRDQVQLAAMVAPQQTSDSITSMLHDYEQTGMLPKWNLDAGESYIMVGDPADPIIADAYAFGARDFNVSEALKAMAAEATTTNNVRPGNATLLSQGYLPYDGSYGCCNFYGPVSSQLEYNTADYAIASLAKATGDTADYTKFATLAQSWENVFNTASGYMQSKLSNGQWLSGFTPGTPAGFVEGTSAQYTPMVPFNLRALINARGGNQAWISFLNSLTSNLTNPSGTNANLSNEPSLEIPYEYDYAGAPYLTQKVVRQVEQQLYFDAPVGQFGNDDMGAMSSAYVWDELGFYPETPGSPVLALGSPVFNQAVVHTANGTITIDAPNASSGAPYIHGMTVNGTASDKAYLDYSTLPGTTTLSYDLSSSPDTSWGSSASAAPPSDPTGERTALAAAGPGDGLIIPPGGSGTASYNVTNLASTPTTVSWRATPSSGVTVKPASGSLTVPARSSASAGVTVTAGQTEGRYSVTFSGTTSSGTTLPDSAVSVAVARPGELWPYDNNTGVSSDGQTVGSSFDGDGFLYSANALAADGITPGGTVTSGGVSYTWPDVAPGQPDNIEAAGQTIQVSLPAGSTQLGLLGSASNSSSSGATGTLTLNYTDGTSQQFPAGMTDWARGAADNYPVLTGNTIVSQTPYRNSADGGRDVRNMYLFASSVSLPAGKTVQSVTLPTPAGGDFHVFAIGAG